MAGQEASAETKRRDLAAPFIALSAYSGFYSPAGIPPFHSIEKHRPSLTHAHIGIYHPAMARAATTADAFNAVAEPRRRQILDLLADGGEHPVNDLVDRLDLDQPQVSKHLRVLREVGLVEVRDVGRQRLYRLNGGRLKPIYDWVRGYEQWWRERFEAMDELLDELKEEEAGDGGEGEQ